MGELIAGFWTPIVGTITPVQWLAAVAVGLVLGAFGCLWERRG